MELIKLIEKIIREQKQHRHIPVDIMMANGNIVLRAFRIYNLDKESGILKGLTVLEEYTHSREGREPEYCLLNIDEIKELRCWDMEINFQKEITYNPLS